MTDGGADIPDVIAVLREFSDDDADMRELAKTFFTTADEILDVLRSNCDGGNSQAWMDAAHKLKGSAGILKAKHLRELSHRAEGMGNAAATDKTQMAQSIGEAIEEIRHGLRDIL